MLNGNMGLAGKLFAVLLLFLSAPAFSASVLIYKNGGCGHCGPYVEGLVAMLEKNGRRDYVIKDFMADAAARADMVALQEQFAVPLEMQGHMLTVIDGKYLFEGHVPPALIESYLKNPKGAVVVTQDKMSGATEYQMLMNGKIEVCPIDQPIENCDGHANNADAGNSLLNLVLPIGLLAVGGAALLYSVKERKPAQGQTRLMQ
ncbi:MAG: DUF411 domain-containing protein [Candidatus Anstonellaceae archaeon]